MKSAQLALGCEEEGEEAASGSLVQSFRSPSVSMATTLERSSSVETSERQEITPGAKEGRGGIECNGSE